METTAAKPYQTRQFWIIAVLTLLGLTLASGAVMDGSRPAEVIGWIVTFLSSLGWRGWVPAPEKTEG